MDTIKKAFEGKTKKAMILMIGVAALAALCGGVLFVRGRRAENASAESAYRQYTVQRGNITMGISESGTALVTRSYLSFPVSAQVEEVYVKVGSVVASGDRIAKLSADDVQDVIAEYQLQLSSAQVELETAVTESKIRLAQAEDAYETSLLDGELANGVYSYTIQKKESDISSAKKRIEDLKEQLEEYEDMEDEYDWYIGAYNRYSREVKNYETLLAEARQKDSGDAAALAQEIKELEEALAAAEASFNSFKDQYKAYGNMDEDDIEDRIDSIKSDLKSARNDLTGLNQDQESAELSAEHTRDITLLEAETAQEVYNETVTQINNSVKEKQNSYNKLKKEYDTLLENIGDGVYLYADCDGAVSAVNISEGDTLGANQSVVTIMDSNEVYVTVSVSEDDISSLYVGQPASVTLSAYEGITVDAEIDTIGVEPARSSGSVSYTVTVKMEPGQSVTVYEGMTCEITFLQKQVTGVVYVNVQAVQYKGNGVSRVLVYDADGEVVEKEVITGFTDGRFVEIIEGLSAGDTVLVESAVRLT